MEIARNSADIIQVTITPWQGPDALTSEALAHDYPWIESETVEPAQVGTVAGIAFADPTNGDQEVWFASGGYLYQAVEQGKDSTFLDTIVARWRFSNK